MEDIYNRLNQISLLCDNWDGYGGCPPSSKTMECVSNFFNVIPKEYIDLLYYEDIVPSSHGTVSIEWELNGYFVSIEIGEKGMGYFSELPNGEDLYNDNLLDFSEFFKVLGKLYE